MPPRLNIRFPLMALGLLSLSAALWAGLIRIGWQLPALIPLLPSAHGPLMVAGFLGTVISLERAVALTAVMPGKGKFVYAVPLLAGVGALTLLIGLPTFLGRGLITLASLGLVIAFAVILCLHFDAAYVTMGVGSLLWLIGNALWLSGQSIPQAAPWWAGYLVLTIAGERLELAKVLLFRRNALIAFGVTVAVFIAGLAFSFFAFDFGIRLGGIGLIGLGLWLLRRDIATRTIRQTGLTRFIAACLLPGYVWLVVGGGLWLWFGGGYTAGPIHDASLHAIFLGFVFSMIFGHAPIIIPAVAGIEIPYRRTFYVHLGLLHASLIARIAGDLLSLPSLRAWGGLWNLFAVILFAATMAWSVVSRRRSS